VNYSGDKIERFLYRLDEFNQSHFRHGDSRMAAVVSHSARFSLEAISRSDAPYHDAEHTVLVTQAGETILEGMHVSGRTVTQKEWAHFVIALVFHDIGYVKGICRSDHDGRLATGKGDEVAVIPSSGTDAALSRYHVDRGLLLLQERFRSDFDPWRLLDADVIRGYIEMTRFPFPPGESENDDPLAEMIRAADLIGQLGDPNRLDKCSALFLEFEETGLNAQLGYHSPADIRDATAEFYRKVAAPRIQKALEYLRLTREGSDWIAHLQANVGERIL
jgi:hypothetical protein